MIGASHQGKPVDVTRTPNPIPKVNMPAQMTQHSWAAARNSPRGRVILALIVDMHRRYGDGRERCLRLLADERTTTHDYCVDDLDYAIIDELCQDGRLTNHELAQRIGLTAAPCLRRVRRLETEGVITGYTAVVDHAALGRAFEVIVNADLVAKDLAVVTAFEERVTAMSEVVELRRMFGLPDYLIRVRTADVQSYEEWLTTRLMGDPAIARVDSRLTMKVLKQSGP